MRLASAKSQLHRSRVFLEAWIKGASFSSTRNCTVPVASMAQVIDLSTHSGLMSRLQPARKTNGRMASAPGLVSVLGGQKNIFHLDSLCPSAPGRMTGKNWLCTTVNWNSVLGSNARRNGCPRGITAAGARNGGSTGCARRWIARRIGRRSKNRARAGFRPSGADHKSPFRAIYRDR